MIHRNPLYDKKELNELINSYKPYLEIFNSEYFKTISEWDGKDFLKHITINI